jgi:hypothetical protein
MQRLRKVGSRERWRLDGTQTDAMDKSAVGHACTTASKLVHYYLDTGGKPRKEIPLGSNYVLAVQKWAELTNKKSSARGGTTFADVLAHYWENVIPTKAPLTPGGQ